jgi:beta-glucosidase
VRTSSWDHAVSAVVECWLAGQATGSALADVLTGAVNPSGRLAETIPLRLEDSPSFLNFPGEEGHVRYGEGIFVGYRGFDAADLPVAYPFGHGLSYTTFEYSDLSVHSTGSLDGGDLSVTVECSVTNTGTRDGQEVAQLYVSSAGSPVARPPRELKGFRKLSLAAGETGRASFSLASRDLAYWSREHRDWTVQPGSFELAIGASSRDLRLAQVLTVDGTPRRGQLTAMSTLQEWLADPAGGEALRREVGTSPDGRPAGILGSEELISVIGNFPLHTLTAFPGLGVTRKVLRRLTSPITGVTKGQ